MSAFVFTFLAGLLGATVIALEREVRLRKALEQLLRILLSRWRTHASNQTQQNPTAKDSRTTNDHERLQ
jgi:hypothetical protein